MGEADQLVRLVEAEGLAQEIAGDLTKTYLLAARQEWIRAGDCLASAKTRHERLGRMLEEFDW